MGSTIKYITDLFRKKTQVEQPVPSPISSEEREEERKRIHPLLPTVDYAWSHREKVYSDHLPRGGEWKPLENAPPLQFRSWNIMGGGASGFDNKRDGDFLNLETDSEKTDRLGRIADTISKWKEDKVDFIALQEVDRYNAPTILTKLGFSIEGNKLKSSENTGENEEWGYVFKDKQLTIYRKSSLTYEADKADFRYQNELIQIHNVYMGHANFPDKHHNEVQKKLNSEKPSIVLGDFNCRFASAISKKASALFTVVTSKFFRSSKQQGGDHVDAALVKEGNGLKQLETWVIDPATGKKYEAPSPTTELPLPVSDEEKSYLLALDEERSRFSPVMKENGMDDDIALKVHGFDPILEKVGISVFSAYNSKNESRIALQIPDRFLYALCKNSLNPEDKIICNDYPQGTPSKVKDKPDNESCVFLKPSEEQVKKFISTIKHAERQMKRIERMFPDSTFSITNEKSGETPGLYLEIIKAKNSTQPRTVLMDRDLMKNLKEISEPSTSPRQARTL